MSYFTSPHAFRMARVDNGFAAPPGFADMSATGGGFLNAIKKPAHSSHPDFGHLILLVFEAVLEVVFISLPGYIVARSGMFSAEHQKFLANLNVQLFTPCLIFTKLASQLTADKLLDLAIIPAIFLVQLLVSYLCAITLSKLFGFGKRPRNFVIAMSVFGNSNSLPISLVLSLSKTISGLHWDKVPGDNDNEVGARGILYLVIFQQLGQIVRWSWGYNVLLAPPDQPEEEHDEQGRLESGDSTGDGSRSHHTRLDRSDLLQSVPEERESLTSSVDDVSRKHPNGHALNKSTTLQSSEYESGAETPVNSQQQASPSSSSFDGNMDQEDLRKPARVNSEVLPTPTNGNLIGTGPGNMLGHDSEHQDEPVGRPRRPGRPDGWLRRASTFAQQSYRKIEQPIESRSRKMFNALPKWLQTALEKTWNFLYQNMNPPLWSMLIALIVASVPILQHWFFTPGTFINNSVTRAVQSNGQVAVPLILVVLGANLARNTLPQEDKEETEVERKTREKEDRNILIASLVSRMVLPTIIMAPLLAVTAKFVPISILDDPIFVIVCFLLTGAPSALQLAQICQLNNVYVTVMSNLLFQSYVVWILPSTLVLVMLALEVVEWAAA